MTKGNYAKVDKILSARFNTQRNEIQCKTLIEHKMINSLPFIKFWVFSFAILSWVTICLNYFLLFAEINHCNTSSSDFSMDGGELFERIQLRGDTPFTERGQ